MASTGSPVTGKEKSMTAGPGFATGSGHMFGKMGVEPMQPGISAPATPPAAKNNPPAGGKTGVMGKQGGAAPAVAGQVSTGGRPGDNSFSVKGGSGHMFGYTPSSPAKPL